MTISRIAKTKQGRFSLFDENGDFLFSIDGETMVKNHVREGAALDAASLEALKEQSDIPQGQGQGPRVSFFARPCIG